MPIQSISIIGYGRFGKVLTSLLQDDYTLKVTDPHLDQTPYPSTLEEALSSDLIIPAIPINAFETWIQTNAHNISETSTVMDVCSVKTYPAKIMQTHLAPNIGIICSHPMFGPDSLHAEMTLNFAIHCVRDPHNHYDEIKSFFSQRFNVIEMPPEEHDQHAARSQGLIHFISRQFKAMNLGPTPIDTYGFQCLLKLVEDNCQDTEALFKDLIRHNPYSNDTINALKSSFKLIENQLDLDSDS